MTNGIIYSLVNRFKDTVPNRWYTMLVQSIHSLKNHMDIPICVVTNVLKLKNDPLFDHVIYVPFNECPLHKRAGKGIDYHIFKWKYLMPASPFENTLHLDSDTLVLDSFYEVFDLLEHFDLVTKLSVHYLSKRFPDVPDSFPELTGGYIIWKQTSEIKRFFEVILDLVTRRSGGTDEPFIRKALYHSHVRYSIIQNDYCVNYGHPQYLFGKAKIIHGQSPYITEDAKIINYKVYDQFGPFKRLLYGNKAVFFKKKKQKVMFVKETLPYHGNGWVQDVSEEERKTL